MSYKGRFQKRNMWAAEDFYKCKILGNLCFHLFFFIQDCGTFTNVPFCFPRHIPRPLPLLGSWCVKTLAPSSHDGLSENSASTLTLKTCTIAKTGFCCSITLKETVLTLAATNDWTSELWRSEVQHAFRCSRLMDMLMLNKFRLTNAAGDVFFAVLRVKRSHTLQTLYMFKDGVFLHSLLCNILFTCQSHVHNYQR